MKLILTSFGIGHKTEPNNIVSDAYSSGLFYRMPPINMRIMHNNQFMPDYVALLLFEKVVVDSQSFASLQETAANPMYSKVAEVVKALHKEAFVELVDYQSILNDNRILLKQMLENDLKYLEQWVGPLKTSIELWSQFRNLALSHVMNKSDEDTGFRSVVAPPIITDDRIGALGLHYFATHSDLHTDNLLASTQHSMVEHDSVPSNVLLDEALRSSRKRRKATNRAALREALTAYLNNVNANLVLSNHLETGFHDWADYSPFYHQKLLSIGKKNRKEQARIEQAHKLFEVSFPEFAIEDTKALMKILKDKRVLELRKLVEDAVEGKAEFDQAFARNIFKEVLGVESQVARYRNIASWATKPVDFIPGVGNIASTIIEETANFLIGRQTRQKHRWFYLLSDVSRDKGNMD